MTNTNYRFRFAKRVDLDEAESTLHLAILAAQGLYPEPMIRMAFFYERDDASHQLALSGGEEISDTIARIFTALITQEFGPTSFNLLNASLPSETVSGVIPGVIPGAAPEATPGAIPGVGGVAMVT